MNPVTKRANFEDRPDSSDIIEHEPNFGSFSNLP